MEPLDRSAIWPYVDGEPGSFYYQRYGHPTGAEAERALEALEGGTALLFPSGAAATAALVLALLEPGDTIALARDAYYGTSVLFRELERWGLHFVEFDQTGAPPADTDLVWIESPSNPLLTVPDFEAASAHPARLVIDATASTPVYLRPLERGADFAVHSATKYLGGHHDVLLGAVVCRDPGQAERLLKFRTTTGIVAAPDPAWLLLRGLKTLELRVRRASETALELARRLDAHVGVERVYYPGLATHPQREVAASQFPLGGGMLAFELAGGPTGDARQAATAFIDALTIPVLTASLGSIHTIVVHPPRTTHRQLDDTALRASGISPGLLRCSVGLEDAADLEADFAAALEAARQAVGAEGGQSRTTDASATPQVSHRPRALAGEASR